MTIKKKYAKFATVLHIFIEEFGVYSRSSAWIGDAKVAIEIKSTEQVKTKYKAGLRAFKEEHPDCRLILVSLEPITRKAEDIEMIYVLDFFKMLWNGDIF